jgi:hypothetical protein
MTFATVLERLQRLDNPYPGLRPFEPQEAYLFYGRDPQIAGLAERVAQHRFLAVVGASGCGKSSLVLAGLLPALQSESVWRVSIMRPRGAPYTELAKAVGMDETTLRRSSFGLLNAVTGGVPVLLVVDQFEELFRYQDQESLDVAYKARTSADAAEFVQLLLTSTQEPGPVSVILTMRSDYLGRCAEFRGLPEALNGAQYLVPRLSREERREAVEGPLGRVRIAQSLVQEILNEVGDAPDRLPVLQHVLMRTWQQWRKADRDATREINRDDYRAAGSMDGALDQHGNELMEGQPRGVVETIFRRLTAVGASRQERRDPATVADLYELCGAVSDWQRAEVLAVLDRFRLGDATFLTPRDGNLTPDTYIDITHESLMRIWRILRDEWMPAEQRAARTLLRLRDRAEYWRKGGPFLTGLDLSDAVKWNEERNKSAAWARHYRAEADIANVVAYIATSREDDERREQAERERRERDLKNEQQLRETAEGRARAELESARRAKRLSYVFLVMFLASLVMAAMTVWATMRAHEERKKTEGLNKKLKLNNDDLDYLKNQLLRQNGWTESSIATANEERVQQSLRAGEKLLALTGDQSEQAAMPKVPIYYHPKRSEPANALVQNWKLMGYSVFLLPAHYDETADVLWFRGQVSPDAIRPVALTLIRAGIQCRAIRRLSGSGPTKMEIGYDPAYQDLPPWTVEQVLMQKSFDEPRAGTGQ